MGSQAPPLHVQESRPFGHPARACPGVSSEDILGDISVPHAQCCQDDYFYSFKNPVFILSSE